MPAHWRADGGRLRSEELTVSSRQRPPQDGSWSTAGTSVAPGCPEAPRRLSREPEVQDRESISWLQHYYHMYCQVQFVHGRDTNDQLARPTSVSFDDCFRDMQLTWQQRARRKNVFSP